MIVTDQERYIDPKDLPSGYELEGHKRLAQDGVVFKNHQIASCVCTPSRAVLYTGQHIQNNGMFDNTNFPWGGSLSTEIDTIGDLLRKEGYYTAYKGKWHLTEEFETINDLHAPKELLSEKMEAYGFSDYFGIGDIIAHTEGGYLHDNVISAMTRSWLRGKGEQLKKEKKPWFLSVNLVNPHDVMYYNTDAENNDVQTKQAMMRLNYEPKNALYQQKWDVKLPPSRKQSLDEKGRPTAHTDYRNSRSVMVGAIPNEDERWKKLNNYYLNCLKDVDNNVVEILNELDELGIMDNAIVIFTSYHGELCGAHGLSGKGATAYQEQNNVPFMMVHPSYDGGKTCKAVTSHVDIATTLISLAGGDPTANKNLPGKDISTLLKNPEKASVNELREGTLYNYNMFAYIDQEFFRDIGKFLSTGGKQEDLPKQGYKPNLKKRGAIRSIFDGKYKFSRYHSPLEHHIPTTLEDLFANNDIELYDITNDPHEMKNLALHRGNHDSIIELMNNKLNDLIKEEVGDDVGQMLPSIEGKDWKLSASFKDTRL
ncbi:MAG: sulfatase-like hydrolase/transferase [Sulfurovum sp.]|nr:sulfatase-like hydrolase/transferase [Sulfurovaceae bacterium]